ncbi:MAG: response regulator [Lachnospiraceae bacterium]
MEENIIIRNLKVLVVDDNMVNVMVLSTILERYGIEADTAESGMEAVERVCAVPYDIILMDYLMPGMDGVETTRQVMQVSEGKNQPKIIGVSATVDEAVTKLFTDAGADCVIKKPLRIEDFEMKLKQYGFIKGEGTEGSSTGEECVDSAGFLSLVEGLNYDEGISLMAGSLDNYMKVLNVSVKNILEHYNKLEEIRDTEKLEAMSMHFHSLKGIFLNIAANKLAGYSQKMEMSAKEYKRMYIISQINEYMETVKEFHHQLKIACDYYNQKNRAKKTGVKIEGTEFIKNLNKLKESIDNYEYIEITDLLEKMLAGSNEKHTVKLQEMYDAIQNFQYDEALEILNTMYND